MARETVTLHYSFHDHELLSKPKTVDALRACKFVGGHKRYPRQGGSHFEIDLLAQQDDEFEITITRVRPDESQKRREALEYLALFVETRDKVVAEGTARNVLDAEGTARNVLAEMERRFGVKL